MTRTAITINFPELAELVDQWRLETVEEAKNGVPPHITLLFPWVSSAISQFDIAALSRLCGQTQRFEVEFEAVRYFDRGTIYLSLKDDQDVRRLSKKIWAEYPDFPPYDGLHSDPISHLTVAEGDTGNIQDLFAEITLSLIHI